MKRSLKEKDLQYQDEMVKKQTDKDRDMMELRRIMDKIDMSHHERFEKMVQKHEEEIGEQSELNQRENKLYFYFYFLEQLNAESEKKMKEVEAHWQNQIAAVRASLDSAKEQMEIESQQKIENLIQQHRAELGM